MRISGGRARGIPLRVPKGDAVRPATDGLRQAVFSSLGPVVEGARFLDLFAGSGAYGLEALSRGAAGGFFVERDARTADCIRHNIAAVCRSLRRDEAGLTVVEADVLSFPFNPVEPPEIVFVDPPYEQIAPVAPALFASLARAWPATFAPLVVFELPGELDLSPAGWTCLKRLGRGARQPTAAFFRRTVDPTLVPPAVPAVD